MSDTVYIVILDDMAVDTFKWDETVQVCGVNVAVKLHPTMCAVGDWTEGDVAKRRMNSQANYHAALLACKEFSGTAVCFCDYEFNGVAVNHEHITAAGPAAIEVAGRNSAEDAVAFYNDSRQGLLLAVVLAGNRQADVDIIIVTGATSGLSRDLKAVLAAVPGVSIRAGTSLSRSASERIRSEVVQKAVVSLQERLDLPDPGYWNCRTTGDSVEKWFIGNDGDVPHTHTGTHNPSLVQYLQHLGLDEKTAQMWLKQPGCFYAIRAFVGGCSRTHGHGQKPLTLGCLAFVLLRAVGAGSWASTFSWNVGPDVILDAESSSSRRFILSCHKMFVEMSRRESDVRPGTIANGVEGSMGNFEVMAGLEHKKDGTHFLVSFGPEFDCATGRDAGHASLISRCLLFAFGVPADGSKTKLIHSFLAASRSIGGAQRLFTSVYPVRIGDSTWTRIDFKARA